MQRTLAIIERELRRFRRSPTLIVISLIFPVVQLVILGYAFGGNVKHLKVGVVDQDHGVPAVRIRELSGAIAAGARTFETVDYSDQGQALTDLRNGRLNGVLTIPPGFSRRTLARADPHIALVEDNTDSFVSSALAATLLNLVTAFNQPGASGRRVSGEATLDVVEVYPYVPYIQYLLPGSVVMSIFMMVMIGGGIIFIDDKARGLHEGYLVTPITKTEMVFGLNLAGAIKAVLTGVVITVIGALLAGVSTIFSLPTVLGLLVMIVLTSIAFNTMMFLLMVRVDDPLVPRAIFGILNTLLFFPSGSIYPVQAFPAWLRAIAYVDPFTYAVAGFKGLLLKEAGFVAIVPDMIYLAIFGTVALSIATPLFKRTL